MDYPHIVKTEAELRALIGEPIELVKAKISDRLNPLTRQFIERSPFLCIATSDSQGHCDVSPRGDPAGFVRVLDDSTLLVPERPGNRLADTLRNILQTGRIGLLFLIPGVCDTFRVNGRACLTRDAAMLAESALEGKPPRLGIIVEVEEAYTQCAKAFLRSHLWDPERFIERAALPTNGEIHRALAGPAFDSQAYDAARAERYARREGFY